MARARWNLNLKEGLKVKGKINDRGYSISITLLLKIGPVGAVIAKTPTDNQTVSVPLPHYAGYNNDHDEPTIRSNVDEANRERRLSTKAC